MNSSTVTFDITNTVSIYTDANGGADVITNVGTFELTVATGGAHIFPYFTNTGVIDALAATLEFDGGGAFGGTLTGDGQINFGGGTSTLTAGAVLSVANLGFDGGTLLLADPLNYSGSIYIAAGDLVLDGGPDVVSGLMNQYGGNFDINGGALNVTGGFSSTVGTLAVDSGSVSVTNGTLGYDAWLTGPGRISLDGTTTIANSSANEYYIARGVAITNNGTLDLNQGLYFYDQYGAGSSIINPTGSTINVTVSWSVPQPITALTLSPTRERLSRAAVAIPTSMQLSTAPGW